MKKRFLSMVVVVVMLISLFPVMASAEAYAGRIYVYLNPEQVGLLGQDSNCRVQLKYESESENGERLMSAVGNGYYFANVNATVNHFNFEIWNFIDNNAIWSSGAEYPNTDFNCLSFENDPNMGEWKRYEPDGQEQNRLLFFTPSNAWLTYNEGAEARFSVSFNVNGKMKYVEMIPYGDGSYVTGEAEGGRAFVFGLMRGGSEDPKVQVLKSASANKTESVNHYTLNESPLNQASGRWSTKTISWDETPSGGNTDEGEEHPSEAQVKWGYTSQMEEGYSTLEELLENGSTQKIYAKLLVPVGISETIEINDSDVTLDLNGNSITSDKTIFSLNNSTLVIENSQDGTGFGSMAGIDSTGYMFEVRNSVLSLLGGIYSADGDGHINQVGSDSITNIGNAVFEGLVTSVINYSAGKVRLVGGTFNALVDVTDIVYTGTVFNNTLEIIKVGSLKGVTYKMTRFTKTVNVASLGEEGVPYVTNESGQEVQVMAGSETYVLSHMLSMTFSADGDIKNEAVVYGQQYIIPDCETVAQPGKRFSYWRASGGTTAVYYPGDMIVAEKSMSFTAEWANATIITITFISEHSGERDEESVSATSRYPLPECTFTPPHGKVFKAWKIGEEEYNSGERVTFTTKTNVYAVWEDGIPLVYKSNNRNNETYELYYKEGSTATLIENEFTPEAGKSFTGWQINNSFYEAGEEIKIDSPTEAYAQWMAGFKVTYKSNNSKNIEESFVYESATEIILPDSTYFNPENGYSFVCWRVNGEDYNPGEMLLVTTTTEILAIWGKPCKLTYVYRYTPQSANEIVRQSAETVVTGMRYSVKAYEEVFSTPLLSEHIVQGWKDNDGKLYNAGEVIEIKGNTTLTLDYKTAYVVTLNPDNGGIEETTQYEVEKDGYFTLPSEIPTPPGENYYFEGWKRGTETSYYKPAQRVQITQPGGNLFVAVWTQYTELSELSDVYKDGIMVGKKYPLPEKTISLTSGALVEVIWTVKNAGGTNAVIEDYNLSATGGGSLVLAYTARGTGEENATILGEAYITVSDNYIISTYEEMWGFIDLVNSGVTDVNATLADDIDMKGLNHTPIGKSSKPYSGTFDGNGYTIRNLNIKATDSPSSGLFGNVSGGIIKNLGIVNAIVNDSEAETGILAGNLTNAVVENVFITGEFEFRTQDEKGFAGKIINSELKNCFITGSLFATENSGTLTNCFYLAESPNQNSVGENKSLSEYESGEVAYILKGDDENSIWGQQLGEENYPVLGGVKVYKYISGYSNENIFGFVENGSNSVTVNIPLEGGYIVIFADYDGGRLANFELVPVNAFKAKEAEATITKGFTLDENDKIMLMKDSDDLKPLCKALIVE